jgi:RNA polymerase sigma factor (sigma-70 family)
MEYLSRTVSKSPSLPTSWSSVKEAVSCLSAPIKDLSNEELIRRCQTGCAPDRAAFSELLQRYQIHVEKILCHLAPDWQDRADLVQEVWIRVYRNLPRLSEPGKFSGWLSRITTNLFYDELRKRKRRAPLLSLDAPLLVEEGEMEWEIAAETPEPGEEMNRQEFYSQLQAAIAELPDIFRTTIMLREIEGMSYEEIAEITQSTLGTVKSRIARARYRLQLQLQPYLEG